MRWKLVLIAPLAILGILLFAAIGGFVVQQLWNWLLPPLFGWPQLGFWQALGLLVLCRILFGGSGWHGSRPRRRVIERISERVSERVAERMEHMTPEERERLRHGLRGRCGFGPSSSETPEP